MMRRVFPALGAAAILLVLGEPVAVAVFSAPISAAHAATVDCEKLFKERLKAVREQASAAREATAARFDAQEADLRQRQARVEEAHKKAISELLEPNKKRRGQCQKLNDKIHAIQKDISAHTGTLKPDLDEQTWQATMSQIKALQARSSATEAQLKTCRAKVRTTHVAYGKRQEDMLLKASAAAATNSLLNDLNSTRRQTREDQDRAEKGDVARLHRLYKYCENNGEWLGGDGSKVANSCLCKIRAALAQLSGLLDQQRKMRARLRRVRRAHLMAFEDFMRAVRQEVSDQRGSLAGKEGEVVFNLVVDIVSGVVDIGDDGYRVYKTSKTNKATEAREAGIKSDGTWVPGTKAGEAQISAKIARKSGDVHKTIKELYSQLQESKSIAEKLKLLEKSQRAFQETQNALVQLVTSENKQWDAISQIACLKKICQPWKEAEARRQSVANWGVGRDGRQKFVAAAFNKAGPSHRLYLADCAACKSLKLLLELKNYRDHAAISIAELEQAVVDQHRTLIQLQIELGRGLGREAHGPNAKLAMLGVQIVGGVFAPVSGPIVASIDYMLAEGGDVYIPLYGTIKIEGELNIKRDQLSNLTANIKDVSGHYDENQISLVYWHHYAKSLDRELGEALTRLMNCFDKDCDKVARTTPRTSQEPPTAFLKGEPGNKNKAPGDDEELKKKTPKTTTALPSDPGKARIVASIAQPKACKAGKICDFGISFNNKGTAAYSGVVFVTGALNGDWPTAVNSNDNWYCASAGRRGTLCVAGISLASGAGETHDFSVVLPRRVTARNCLAVADFKPGSSGRYDPVVAAVQLGLVREGLAAGNADGISGPKTRAAMAAYAQKIGNEEDSSPARLFHSLFEVSVEDMAKLGRAEGVNCQKLALIGPPAKTPKKVVRKKTDGSKRQAKNVKRRKAKKSGPTGFSFSIGIGIGSRSGSSGHKRKPERRKPPRETTH